jgi:hypothetical protein
MHWRICKRRSALLAELRICLVFVLAAGTPHDGTSLPQHGREGEDAVPRVTPRLVSWTI